MQTVLCNAFGYFRRHIHPLIKKYGNTFFEKLKKNCDQPQWSIIRDFQEKCQKNPYFFNIFGNVSFLNRTLGLRNSFLNQKLMY